MSDPASAPPEPSPPRRPASWSRAAALLDRAVTAVDDAADRLWSSRLNPLHQSGTIALVCFGIMVASGLILFLFYSIDEPFDSVTRIERDIPGGGWVRSLHTYAADLALVAIVVHSLKMFLAGRFSGARVRAWLTGVVLVGITLLCGWTGQVMVWDQQAQVVAVELTKLIDLLPLFSLPMGRAFDGVAPVASSFFFMNLFLHVCLPLGLAMALWMHVSRIARPVLWPPRELTLSVVGLLALVALVLRVPLAPRADLLAVAQGVPVDVLYNFWLPAAWRLGPEAHAALWACGALIFASVPWWWRRTRPAIEASWVDPDLCTGCTTCYQDCPFDAITMVPRVDPGRRSELHALVNPDHCVSCGVCAGSCAPMSVGPPSRTGRVQLREEHQRLRGGYLEAGNMVAFVCGQSALARDPRLQALAGVTTRVVECTGGMHTSVLDLTLRNGAPGALVLTCPPRTATCREGPKWIRERVFHDREAELSPRIDKRRVEIAGWSRGEWPEILASLDILRERVQALPPVDSMGRNIPGDASTPAALGVDTLCEPPVEAS